MFYLSYLRALTSSSDGATVWGSRYRIVAVQEVGGRFHGPSIMVFSPASHPLLTGSAADRCRVVGWNAATRGMSDARLRESWIVGTGPTGRRRRHDSREPRFSGVEGESRNSYTAGAGLPTSVTSANTRFLTRRGFRKGRGGCRVLCTPFVRRKSSPVRRL